MFSAFKKQKNFDDFKEVARLVYGLDRIKSPKWLELGKNDTESLEPSPLKTCCPCPPNSFIIVEDDIERTPTSLFKRPPIISRSAVPSSTFCREELKVKTDRNWVSVSMSIKGRVLDEASLFQLRDLMINQVIEIMKEKQEECVLVGAFISNQAENSQEKKHSATRSFKQVSKNGIFDKISDFLKEAVGRLVKPLKMHLLRRLSLRVKMENTTTLNIKELITPIETGSPIKSGCAPKQSLLPFCADTEKSIETGESTSGTTANQAPQSDSQSSIMDVEGQTRSCNDSSSNSLETLISAAADPGPSQSENSDDIDFLADPEDSEPVHENIRAVHQVQLGVCQCQQQMVRVQYLLDIIQKLLVVLSCEMICFALLSCYYFFYRR